MSLIVLNNTLLKEQQIERPWPENPEIATSAEREEFTPSRVGVGGGAKGVR